MKAFAASATVVALVTGAFAVALAAPSGAVTAAPSPVASTAGANDGKIGKLALDLIGEVQHGAVDRKRFDDRMNAVLTADLVAQLAAQLGPLGPPKKMAFVSQSAAGAYHTYRYRVYWDGTALDEVISVDESGKVAGFLVSPVSNTVPGVAVPGPLLSPGP